MCLDQDGEFPDVAEDAFCGAHVAGDAEGLRVGFVAAEKQFSCWAVGLSHVDMGGVRVLYGSCLFVAVLVVCLERATVWWNSLRWVAEY